MFVQIVDLPADKASLIYGKKIRLNIDDQYKFEGQDNIAEFFDQNPFYKE